MVAALVVGAVAMPTVTPALLPLLAVAPVAVVLVELDDDEVLLASAVAAVAVVAAGVIAGAAAGATVGDVLVTAGARPFQFHANDFYRDIKATQSRASNVRNVPKTASKSLALGS